MEGVEGMLSRMKLSEAERLGVRVGRKEIGIMTKGELQAIGKLFSEKQAYSEAIANALGPIWCPIKGVDCKDLGENLFLFTFHQSSGKKRAVEEGP
jgi:hypothetical protein